MALGMHFRRAILEQFHISSQHELNRPIDTPIALRQSLLRFIGDLSDSVTPDFAGSILESRVSDVIPGELCTIDMVSIPLQ
jgi:hypothetical protein